MSEMVDRRDLNEALRLLHWAKEDFAKHGVSNDNWFADYLDFTSKDFGRRTPSLPASAGGGEAILHAALDCPHEIDGEKVVLKASLSKPGNALAQLSTRLSAALKAETTPAALRGYCTDCESETEIQNGRCGCGSGRVIVGGLKAETSR